MKKHNRVMLAVSAGVILLLGLFFVMSFDLNSNSANPKDEIDYNSLVCVYKNTELVECSSNVLTTAGANLIKSSLGDSGVGGPVQYIALCNATAGCAAAAAGSTTLENEYAAGGLSRAVGAYASVGTGNWTITETFTATADNLETNKTGIFNATSSGTLFAENTFTLVTLQTNDQLTIEWNIWVQNA